MIAAQEERKDKVISAIITFVITALILLFLILYKIITPIPPFEFTGDGGMEINFGIYDEGTGNVEGPAIGDATSVVVENSSTKAEETPAEDKEDTYDNGEAVLENKKNDHPKIKENITIIKPEKTKEEIEKEEEAKNASNLLNAYKNKKNQGTGGGDGNSGHAGNEGSPDGNPNTEGMGGHGNNPDFNGNGNNHGKGGTGFSLSGRKILVPPPKVSDSKEEGIVVVNITVDKEGNVVEADPNGKGTTTSSAVLKSKARQAALQAKYSPSDKYESQRGTMVFKFQF